MPVDDSRRSLDRARVPLPYVPLHQGGLHRYGRLAYRCDRRRRGGYHCRREWVSRACEIRSQTRRYHVRGRQSKRLHRGRG